MRGAVSLAAALSVPLEATGEPFPGRVVILVVTVAVILADAGAAGDDARAVLRRVETSDRSEDERQELAARTALAGRGPRSPRRARAVRRDPAGSAQPLRQVWVQARARVVGEPLEGEADLVALRLDLAACRARSSTAAAGGAAAPEVARALRAELDLQEVRLAHAPSA
jgi:CPA1 family monovalent cation:H+ antiporter